MDQVFVDCDIILDLLARREPFHHDAIRLFSAADRQELILAVSSLSFTTIHYLLSRQYSRSESRKKLIQFKTLVQVLPVNEKIIDLSLSSDFNDFEDGVQYFTAIEHHFNVLLTRNLKDYKPSRIPVMTAGEYLGGKQV